jgi:hypothetical protein
VRPEGVLCCSKRSAEEWQGRTDGNIRAIVPAAELSFGPVGPVRPLQKGDYVVVRLGLRCQFVG